MRISYRAKLNGRHDSRFDQTNPGAVWRSLEQAHHNASQDQLKSLGWKVKRHIDSTEQDGDLAESVAAEVIGPKKAGLLRGLAKLLGL